MDPLQTLTVALYGLVVVAGLIAVPVPDAFRSALRSLRSPLGLALAALGRLGLGVVTLLTAAHARTPWALYTLGSVLAVSGLLAPALGRERLVRSIDAFLERGPWAARGWGVLVAAAGIGVLLSLRP